MTGAELKKWRENMPSTNPARNAYMSRGELHKLLGEAGVEISFHSLISWEARNQGKQTLKDEVAEAVNLIQESEYIKNCCRVAMVQDSINKARADIEDCQRRIDRAKLNPWLSSWEGLV